MRTTDSPLTVCLATHNSHKVEELRALLATYAPDLAGALRLLSLADLGVHDAAIEDGSDFESNARKKALHAVARTGHVCLADDSGLEVEALAGGPGIYSARYGGTPRAGQTQDARNREVLLAALSDVPDERRQARFVCVLCLVGLPELAAVGATGVDPIFRRGECRGQLLRSEQGSGGFGYDALFVPAAQELSRAGLPSTRSGLSFGVLLAAEKNRLSHRTHAVVAMLPALRALTAR